jgi:hypothetical protein
MELDLRSLFGLLVNVHSCTHWLIPRNPPPPPPEIGLIYESAIGQPKETTSLCDPLPVALAEGLRMYRRLRVEGLGGGGGGDQDIFIKTGMRNLPPLCS